MAYADAFDVTGPTDATRARNVDDVIRAALRAIDERMSAVFSNWPDGDPLLLRAGIIDSAQIVDASILTAKLADLAVITAKLADASVTEAKIADLAVTAAKLRGDFALPATAIAAGLVATIMLADASVTTPKLAADAVTTPKIIDAAVTHAKVADDAIESNNIKNGAVGTTELADNGVTRVKIPNAEIDDTKLAADSVTTPKIIDAGVTTPKIAGATIQPQHIDLDQTPVAQSLMYQAYIGNIAIPGGTVVGADASAVVNITLAYAQGGDFIVWKSNDVTQSKFVTVSMIPTAGNIEVTLQNLNATPRTMTGLSFSICLLRRFAPGFV